MSPHKVLCRLSCRFNVEFSPVMEHKICGKGIFRFAAMDLIYIFLALAVEPCMKAFRGVLTAEH